MRSRRLSFVVLRLVLSRDRAAALLGDLAEELSRRGSPTPLAGVWLVAQAIGFVAATIVGGLPRGTRLMIDDARHTWRRLRACPGAAVLTTAMLAAAIGLSTGAFAVLDSLVLERAPFAESEALRTVAIGRRRGSGNPELINMMRAWRAAGTFAAVEAAGDVPLATPTSPTSDTAALVTPGLFEMLGVRPIRGRGFTEDDVRSAGGVEPVLISARLWRDALDADDARLGSIVSIRGREYLVIGVMPDDFRFPEPTTVFWRPVSFATTPFPAAAGEHAYVRLPRGVPEADVMRQATQIAGVADSRFVAQPNELVSWPIGGSIDDHAGRAIPLFAGAVGLIFLSLCANAGSLRLAHMTERRRELGVRLSLGASRSRLLRELALEHVAIGIAGTAGGIAIATVLTALAPRFLSDAFALRLTLNPIDVDARATAIAASLGFAAVVVAGLMPAWFGTRVDPAASVKASDRTHTESRPVRLLTRSLLVAQISFASVLLLGALLLMRSFDRMATADRGMNARGVHTMNAFMSSVRPSVLDDVDARLSALPGVEDAVVASAAPPDGNSTFTNRWRTDVVDGVEVSLRRYDVRPDFFPFYGITLLRGRHFQTGDGGELAIVSERVATLLWPNGDPLGKAMRADGPMEFTVIGVAKEITIPSLLDQFDLPEIYVPHVGRRAVVSVGLRCHGQCPTSQQVAEQLRAIDPKAEALGLRSVEEKYARQLIRPRAVAELAVGFATIGFTTCGAGLFAVFSYAVGRRRREFGIRTALGATPSMLRRGVSREAIGVGGLGIAIGVLGVWVLHRVLASVLYGVSAWDPSAWAGMVGIILAVTLVASWRPARQAARIDPVRLLREE